MIRLLAFLTVVSAALLARLLWLSHAVLEPQAGGLKPFDARIWGYSVDQAQLYLQSLNPEALSVYLGQVRVLDTAFPLTLAALLGLATMSVPKQWNLWSRMVLVIPAAAFALMDLSENALVAEILRSGAEQIDLASVDLASQYTITKWVLVALSFALLACVSLARWRPGKTI